MRDAVKDNHLLIRAIFLFEWRRDERNKVKVVHRCKMLFMVFCLLGLMVSAAAGAPVAVFPLQELTDGRNDANLPFSRELAKRLESAGNQIIGPETAIRFMANNRIRTVGYLETFHVRRVREDLGAPFILLGTVSQRKEKPEATMGLTLNLVRTSDVRTVWSFVGSLSTGEERRVLGIGEPRETEELKPILLEQIIAEWPWQIINQMQQVGAISIDSALLQPSNVPPGGEVRGWVRLRNTWPAESAPKVFFRVDDQLYPATVSEDRQTYEADWVAGEQTGRFPVSLLLEWPHYGRTESVLLGNFLVDGTPPLFELDLPGTTMIEGVPTFSVNLLIKPRMIVRKPLSHWRLAFYEVGDSLIGDMTGEGNMPKSFVWKGRGSTGDGFYQVVLEAWDQAGNYAKASREVAMNRGMPEIDLAMEQKTDDITVKLESDSLVPLKYWRLEMWTREGKLLTQSEGEELPAEVGFELPELTGEQGIEGLLIYQDELGKKVSRKVEDFLPKAGKKKARQEKKEDTGISESWVDEF